MTSCGNNVNDFPENQLTKNTAWTRKTFPGGGTAIDGTPNIGGGTAFRLNLITAFTFTRAHKKRYRSPVSYTHLTLPTKRIV